MISLAATVVGNPNGAASVAPSDADLRRYFQELLDSRPELDSDAYELIARAFNFARSAHAHTNPRKTGEPFIWHPVIAARFVADLGLQPEVIAATLLHDVVEDDPGNRQKVKEAFGENIAKLVDALSKGRDEDASMQLFVSIVQQVSKENPSIILAAVIKFADAIHNLSTLDGFPKEAKRREQAAEYLKYSEWARLFGMWHVKTKIENLAMEHLYPEDYAEILAELGRREEYGENASEIMTVISTVESWESQGIGTISVMERDKDPYSDIYRRREGTKSRPAGYSIEESLNTCWLVVRVPTAKDRDAVARRIESEFEAYHLAEMDKNWTGESRIGNGYESIHRTIEYPASGGGTVTIVFQINTYSAYERAQFGVAAYWRYVDKESKDAKEARAMVDYVVDRFNADNIIEAWNEQGMR